MLDNSAIADEINRLRAAEFEAEQRYYEAVEEAELSAKRDAANVWIRAGDALNDYLAKHFQASPVPGETAAHQEAAQT
jgi:hypothetical protein